MRAIVYLLFLFFPLTSWSYSTGTLNETLSDPATGRQLNVQLFYPTADSGPATLHGANAVFTGFSAVEKATVASGRFPLILLSHGSGGNNRSLAWLGASLASRGALVVAASHPGSTTGDSHPETDLTLQTRDMSFMLSHYLNDPKWKNTVDPGRVGVIGHSKGGYSALALAGARITRQRLMHYCETMTNMPDCQFYRRDGWWREQTPDDRLAANYRDKRIKFVVALDPGMSYVFTPESLASLSVPTLIVAAGYYTHMTGKMTLGNEKITLPVVVLPTAGHFDFLPACQPQAKAILSKEGESFICDTPPAVRESLHRQTVAIIYAALERWLIL